MKTDKKKMAAAVVVVIFVTFIHYLNFSTRLESLSRFFLLPISAQFYSWKISVGQWYSKKIICTDQNNLAKTDQLLQTKYSLAVKENERLKKFLNFKSRQPNLRIITTNVVGKTLDSLDKNIIINAGQNQSIEVGNPVVVDDGILVGIVIKVENDMSLVRLINDNNSKIAGTIINHDNSLGVVEGGYGLSVKMNFIPRNEIINIGDLVVTSGLEQNIPRGLLIGEIAIAENESFQPFQQALIKPAVDLDKNTIVSILKFQSTTTTTCSPSNQ